jgi:hypothetical protein
VTLYDARDEQRTGLPLASVPSAEVEVQSGWLVADVLHEGGHGGYSSFALVTADIEADVAAGEDRAILGAKLFGIDDQGVKFQGADHIRWGEFIRASEAALYEGDPTRIVVYQDGAVGGGLSPDGLWEMVQWLFENRDVAVDALAEVEKVGGGVTAIELGRRWITGVRRRQIAKKWRAQGLTAPSIRDYLARYPQWDASQFAKQTGGELSELEARVALTNAGYEEGANGLWRLSNSVEGAERQRVMAEIEERAVANMEDASWSDDFPIDEDESPSADGGQRGV